MNEATALYLAETTDGAELLARVADLPGDRASRVLALRKRGVEGETAGAAADVADARHRARGRFGADAAHLFFTPDTLAQATSPLLADYHARLLAPLGVVADLGCGAGTDAIAIARAGARVVAIERDPARLVFARANARALGVAERITFQQGDVTTLDWLNGDQNVCAVFWDPSRRASGSAPGGRNGARVSRHGDRYEPPLDFLELFRARVDGGVLKLSPALPDEVLAPIAGVSGTVTFLSEARECKEACVAWGAVADKNAAPFSALLLPENIALAPSDTNNLEPWQNAAPVAARVAAFVLDPDPAPLRAHALASLCQLWGRDAARITDADDYLTASDLNPALARAASSYRVVETVPYHPKRVAERLRALDVGRLVVKKRHFPQEPDAVAKALRVSGKGREITLILVRARADAAAAPASLGDFLAVLCEPATT